MVILRTSYWVYFILLIRNTSCSLLVMLHTTPRIDTSYFGTLYFLRAVYFFNNLCFLLLILHASCRRVLTAEFLFLSYFYSLVTIVTSCTSTPHTSYTFLNDTYLNDTYLITSKLIKCYQSKIFYRIHPLYRNHCLLL